MKPRETHAMKRIPLLAAVSLIVCAGFASAATVDLSSAVETTVNVDVEDAAFKGKEGVRVTISEEGRKRLEEDVRRRRRNTARGAGPGDAQGERISYLAVLDGIDFSSGVIEADIAGSPAPGSQGGARGFVGVAFRLQDDHETYDAFYLRPTNGRADDQERRNHSAQYISHPDWPWFRFRQETPSRYETYVDIVPDEWIHIRIEVDGDKARLYVNRAEQPTLIVNDVKSGADGAGKVALWIEGSTVAHFANVEITPR